MAHWKLVLTTAICLFLKVSFAVDVEETAVDSDDAAAVTISAEAQPESEKSEKVEKSEKIEKVEKREKAEKRDRRDTGISNNITINAPASINASRSNTVSDNDVSSVLGAKATRTEKSTTQVAIIPMAGMSDYGGRWGNNITNQYTFGVALEIDATENLGFEVEGGYSRFNTRYLSYPQQQQAQQPQQGQPQQQQLQLQQGQQAAQPTMYGHDFNQYQVGLNAKVYLVRGILNPYLGAGAQGLYYENMDYGPLGQGIRYNRWVGAGQAFVGADVNVAEKVALGLRGAWTAPLFNRPGTQDNGVVSSPNYEDAALMNTYQYRVMGSVRVQF